MADRATVVPHSRLIGRAITEVLTSLASARIVGSSVNDLEKYQVGTSFRHLAPSAGVFVQSCFLVVCVGLTERGGR